MRKTSLAAIAGVIFIGAASSAMANCASIGGALPNTSTPNACPSHRTQDWWVGTWATQMLDQSRGKVVSHTKLYENDKYKTSLIYEDGERV